MNSVYFWTRREAKKSAKQQALYYHIRDDKVDCKVTPNAAKKIQHNEMANDLIRPFSTFKSLFVKVSSTIMKMGRCRIIYANGTDFVVIRRVI